MYGERGATWKNLEDHFYSVVVTFFCINALDSPALTGQKRFGNIERLDTD